MVTLQLFEVGRDIPDLKVAEVTAPTEEQARREMAHYAMMYSQDGPVEIRRARSTKGS